MALIKCPECGENISDSVDSCIHCGFKMKKEVLEDDENITEKGEMDEMRSENMEQVVNVKSNIKKFMTNKLYFYGTIVVIITVIVCLIAILNRNEQSKAIRVDITMNSWYGDIEQILDDFGLEFYAVTSGANCYSGVKRSQFETSKYGILYTEFTYCKSNSIQRLRIYNRSSDQPLRDPKPGELYSYDKYGDRSSSSYA